MRKFLLGLACGVLVTATTTAFASEAIQATIFPVEYKINGQSAEPRSEYTTLNYNGHAYVPIRFVAERLGLGIRYSSMNNEISIMNEPTGLDAYAKTVWQVQYKLDLGQGTDDVQSLLGKPSDIMLDDEKGVWWRYDISAKPGYAYEHGHDFDIDGMNKDELDAQLYVKWTEDEKIERMSFAYTQEVNGQRRIVMQHVLQDGSTPEGLYE